MRRIAIWLTTTIVGVALLFDYRTSTVGAPASAATRRVATRVVPLAGAPDGTVTGPVIDTRWGPVQVAATIAGGRLTDVQALQVPSDNGKDQEINAYAVPILHDEALAAQGANIDTVSGASYTSDGYRQSLQAALDSLAVAPAPAAPVTTATTTGPTQGVIRSVTGPTIDTQWGPVQVRIVVRKGRITDVVALQLPSDNGRDQEISAYAGPLLHDEAIAAQSANIDTVSGASYTSDGYRQSLQGAIDKAGLR